MRKNLLELVCATAYTAFVALLGWSAYWFYAWFWGPGEWGTRFLWWSAVVFTTVALSMDVIAWSIIGFLHLRLRWARRREEVKS